MAWTDKNSFNNRRKAPRLDQLMHLKKLKAGEFGTYRAIGPLYTFAEYWIPIKTKEGKVINIRKLATNWDPKKNDFVGTCPYNEILGVTARIVALQNFIDRKAQDREPKKKPSHLKTERRKKNVVAYDKGEYFIKDMDSDSWTPVVVLRLTTSPCQKIADLTQLNTSLNKKTGKKIPYGPEHPLKGFDMSIKHDPDQQAANQYAVFKERKSKLTEEELDYLLYKLDVEKPETEVEARKEAENMKQRFAGDEEQQNNDDDTKKKKKKRSDKTKKDDYMDDVNDDNDNDNQNQNDNNDNDDDWVPAKRKKSSSKTTAKKKASTSKTNAKKKKRRV